MRFVNVSLGCLLFFLCLLVIVQPAAAMEVERVTPNDPYWSKQWYLRQIEAPLAWTVTTGTAEMIVAVIDGGVDINHPDLIENIWTNLGEVPGDGLDNDQNGYVDDTHGWNFVSRSSDLRPQPLASQTEEAWSHGTFVSSLIAARGNNSIGISGVAWNVKVMPLVALNGQGEGTTGNVVMAMRYAVNHGAKVINLSLVGNEYQADLAQMIERAYQAGVVIVAATGNDTRDKRGRNLDAAPAYPVCLDGNDNYVIGVGGTDTLDQKSPYANYGRSCTDLVAPAQELFGARPSYPHNLRPISGVPGYLDRVTGTSMAAPLVSGAAALLRIQHPEWSPKQVQERLRLTADSIEDNLSETQKGRMGAGRLNVARALGAEPFPQAVSVAHATATRLSDKEPELVDERIIITSATSVQAFWRKQDQSVSWSASGVVERSGWLMFGEEQGAYTILRDKKGMTIKIWFPETGKTAEHRLLVRGRGPWRVKVEGGESGKPIFKFTSSHSLWTTIWRFGDETAQIRAHSQSHSSYLTARDYD